jgi:hypothetical protein
MKGGGSLRSARSRTFYVDGLNEPALCERVMGVRAGNGYFTWMLQQDIERILPYGNGGGEGFSVAVVGTEDGHVTELVADALSEEHNGRTWLESALRDFVARTAQLLVMCGPVTYEIGFLSSGDPPGPPAAFELCLIQPGTLDWINGRPIQYVPRQAAEAVGSGGLGYVHLDPEHLITIRLDDRTEKEVRESVRFLHEASNQRKEELSLMQQATRGPTPYEPMVHVEETGELIAAATVPIGWTVRDLYTKHRLDPYVAWRTLRFLGFKIRLRDAAIDGVNRALTIAGPPLDFDVHIELSGVPTSADVEAGLADLEAGRRSLSDLMRMAF